MATVEQMGNGTIYSLLLNLSFFFVFVLGVDTLAKQFHQIFDDKITYIEEVLRLNYVVLSIRWTTHKCAEWDTGEYKLNDTNEAIGWLKDAGVDQKKGQEINFFIRAHYAYRSREALKDLYNQLQKNNPVSFTIYSDDLYWFDPNDPVKPINYTELNEAIDHLGREHVHLQVSDQVRQDLNLPGLPDPRAKTKNASEIVQLSVLSTVLLILILKIIKIIMLHYNY